MSYWIEGEQWLTAREAASVWRSLTETELSDSTWRRMGPDDRLTEMGLRVSDDGKLTHKVAMLELIRETAERTMRGVDEEMAREVETMRGRKKQSGSTSEGQ